MFDTAHWEMIRLAIDAVQNKKVPIEHSSSEDSRTELMISVKLTACFFFGGGAFNSKQ
jgi:hypothetical protein